MTDIKKKFADYAIKRTYYFTKEQDMEIKIRAARDNVKPSDVVQRAVDVYLGLDKKKK
jgi:hypothetical protein